MGTVGRWMCAGVLVAVAATAYPEDVKVLPSHTVNGALDENARLQTVHDAMTHECGATPNSARCRRLKREFRQEAKNCQKRQHK